MSASDRFTVLIVDDDPGYRVALTALLESEGIEVAGAAANGAEAVEAAERLRPTIATMDMDMPVMDGVAATRRIAPLGVHVVIVSGSESRGSIGDAVTAGAVATIVKSKVPTALVPLLRAIAAGEHPARAD